MIKKKDLTIKEKNELVDSVIEQLKKEYIGIDEQIDIIMNNMRAWYIYPNLLDHPVVVNCWGLTGCGKTSLIKRIVALMGLEEDLQYYNFAEIGENTSSQIEGQIENTITYDKTFGKHTIGVVLGQSALKSKGAIASLRLSLNCEEASYARPLYSASTFVLIS